MADIASPKNLNFLFRSGVGQVVPLVILTDGSDFGNRARDCVLKWRPKDLQYAILPSEVQKAKKAVDWFLEKGYRQKLLPITLWEHQPAWFAWFLGTDKPDTAKLVNAISSLPKNTEPPLKHLVFLALDSQQFDQIASLWAKTLKNLNQVVLFFLERNQARGWDEAFLGAGAAAYAYGGWRRYCETGDLRYHIGPVHIKGNCHDLTVARCAPDVEYHAHHWAGSVAKQLKTRLLARASQVEPLKLKTKVEDLTEQSDILSPRGVLDFLVPEGHADKGYFVTPANDASDAHEIEFKTESYHFTYHEESQPAQRRWRFLREELAESLSKLKNLHYFLRLVTLPNARKRVETNLAKLPDLLMKTMRGYLGLPDAPDSLLNVLHQKLSRCQEYLATLKSVRSVSKLREGAFGAQADKAVERISDIPDLTSAFLRLLLIAIGLAGLVVGPVLWRSIVSPWSHPLLREVAMGAGALLVLLTIGVAANYLFATWRASRSLTRVRQTSLDQHAGDVADTLMHSIKAACDKLLPTIDTWEKDRETLRKDLETHQPPAASIPQNSEPFFSDNCGHVLLNVDRQKQLVGDAYKIIKAAMQEGEWPTFDIKKWQKALADSTTQVSKEALEALPVEEWAEAERPDAGRREDHLDSLLREAKQGMTNPPTVCFLSEDWKRHCRTHTTVEFYDLRLPQMIAVSVKPRVGGS